MTLLHPTYRTGATTLPTDMVTAPPERCTTEEVLGADVGLEGIDMAFLLGQLSMMLAHERCGRHLYRSVAGRTNNAMLKRQYEHFGRETEQHVRDLEEIVTLVGGDPQYVSPAARAAEKAAAGLVESTFLLNGSIDMMTAETVMLTAVLQAEAVDHANWQFLTALVEELPESDIQRRLDELCQTVEDQEDEHLEWASETRLRMAMLQTMSTGTARLSMQVEEAAATIASWFE